MYKADSKIEEEFINHQEILDTMSYAETHKSNRALIESLIDKAARCKGLTHRLTMSPPFAPLPRCICWHASLKAWESKWC